MFQKLSESLAGHIAEGAVPGLVALLDRQGETQVIVLGATSVGGPPMARDTLFRITSMTKPLCAAVAMMLVDDGVLTLDEPADRLLPELAGRRVLRRLDGPLDEVEPAQRPISLRDLLTLRLGLGMILGPNADDYPIQQAIDAAGLMLGPPLPRTTLTPDEWMDRLGQLPLMAQPGERWMYDAGMHVLGVLLARAAEQPLETLLRERLLEPLGMTDTHFTVPPEKLDRFADCYRYDPNAGLTPADPSRAWLTPPSFPEAASGLVSTAEDYLAFARMLLAGGVHDDQRLISQASVAEMTTDQLTDDQRRDGAMFLDGRGWGLGMSTAAAGRAGAYGWDGGFGTSWRSDPSTGLSAILLTQRLFDPDPGPAYGAFHAALDSLVTT